MSLQFDTTELERKLEERMTGNQAKFVIHNALVNGVKQWVKDHESEHHKTAERLGSTPSGNYSPSKVKFGKRQESSQGTDYQIDVSEIKGIGRAFGPVDIYPKNGQWLTIPLHRDAVGVSARNISGLFRPGSKENPKNVLALMKNGALVFMYALSKHVHQNQDASLLPNEQYYAKIIEDTLVKEMS